MKITETTRKIRTFTLELEENELMDLTQLLWTSDHKGSHELFCALPEEFTAKVDGRCG